MAEILDPRRVRSGTWGQLWVNGELVAEAFSCQIVVKKNREDVPRCGTMTAGKKLTGMEKTGSIGIYNATSRLIELEAAAQKEGKDLNHVIITDLNDPDNGRNQRVAVRGVSFDELTLADWEAGKLGKFVVPFIYEDFEVLDS